MLLAAFLRMDLKREDFRKVEDKFVMFAAIGRSIGVIDLWHSTLGC